MKTSAEGAIVTGTRGRDSLRITHVITTDGFAGTERYVVDVSTELARRGHNVHVVGGRPATMPALLGDAVSWVPGASAGNSLTSLVQGRRRDIVHSHITKSDFVAVMAAPITGGARVSTRHITARRGYSPMAARLAHVVRRLLTTEIAVSSFVAQSVETRVDEVLVNGVRVVADHETEREPIVLVAQRLAEEKQTAVALRAWSRSGLGDRGWRLVLAGHGESYDNLVALATELNIESSVTFLGWVDDLPAHLAKASILLATAPAEPCGLTILEAMANGLPVVATHSGGHLETLGREPSAVFFSAGDAADAAVQLRRLADDESLRSQYGKKLKELQRAEFTIEGHVDQLERIYAQALGS